MLKAHRSAHVALAVALDILALVLGFFIAWFMRDRLGTVIIWGAHFFNADVDKWVHSQREVSLTNHILLSGNPLVGFKRHLWILYLSLPFWLFFVHAQRGYDAEARRTTRDEFALSAYAGFLGSLALLVFIFLAKEQRVSRLLIVDFLLTGVACLWLGRALVMPALERRRRRPVRNVLVVGNLATALKYADILGAPGYRWTKLIGYISDESGHDAPDAAGSPNAWLGTLGDLETVLDKAVVDEVVLVRSQADAAFTGQQEEVVAWSEMLALCLQRGRTVSLVDDIVPPFGAKVEAAMVGPLPALVLHNTPQSPMALAIKNLADRVAAFLAIIVLSPLLLIIALAIKFTSPGPILFKQKRVGLNGRLFSFYKFRSMVINAEEILEKNRAEWEKHNKMSGGFFKWEDDPRITRVGKFLRKTSLDELPQFWNVLRGDMSLVGPRPPLPKEVAQLKPSQRRKLSVKGGLTCLWQVSGRNDIDTDEWMRLDLEYIDNWSLWLDFKLVLKTIVVMVRPRGAS